MIMKLTTISGAESKWKERSSKNCEASKLKGLNHWKKNSAKNNILFILPPTFPLYDFKGYPVRYTSFKKENRQVLWLL